MEERGGSILPALKIQTQVGLYHWSVNYAQKYGPIRDGIEK